MQNNAGAFPGICTLFLVSVEGLHYLVNKKGHTRGMAKGFGKVPDLRMATSATLSQSKQTVVTPTLPLPQEVLYR